ncbi:MAG: molybdopterin-guanine dinucleotide biosynthesis protein B [Formivibrio sp.]|nr:molybdopterin-guanine dinucleotide biosynthesis protein B [Formivibrio sp.]
MGKVFGIVGYSGSGKTTLIERLLPEFARLGRTVNVIKHSHHDLELEPPAKDSARFRAAGAAEVLVASPYRFAIVHELHGAPEPTLAEQLARLAPADLTLVEGFKREAIPKLEVWRAETGKPSLAQVDPHIVAVASTARLDLSVPCLDLDQPAAIAAYILDYLEK